MIAAFTAHDADEIASVREPGDGIEQGGTDPTEDGTVGGNPQGECEDGHESKARRLGEDAQGETCVMDQNKHLHQAKEQ